MILTDEEIVRATHGTGSTKLLITIARRIEAAVLEKLRQQEPAFYYDRHDPCTAFKIDAHSAITAADAENFAPLYAAPVPAAVPYGMKLVPVRPDGEQLTAVREAISYARRISGDEAILAYDAMLCTAPAVPAVLDDTRAAADVLAERRRQVESEGWTPEHDDLHSNGEMAVAASCYALHAHDPESHKRCVGPMNWPWDYQWWKPRTARRDLVKAGALILAEIERLDRAAAVPTVKTDAAIDAAMQKGGATC